jgi:Fe-coproporphyrin III synthase
MSTWARLFPILRDRVRPPAFNSLFLFVTSRCNSKCRTCFYFEKLNRKDDLSFDQIRTISETAPSFRKLWLSGGEPTLREELGEIMALFVRNNGVRNINLPTNGLVSAKVFQALDRVLAESPDVSVDLNFSLDGLANMHDAIRGVPNNFTRTLATIREAEDRYRDVRRLRVNAVTVITRENYGDILQLGLELLGGRHLDGHYFEVVRGETPDPGQKGLNRQEVAELHRRLMPLHRSYARRLFAHLPPGAREIATMYYLGNLQMHFDLHEACLEGPRPWPMPCTAGQTSLVLDHDGAFRACELRAPVGNLREFGYDVSAALGSGAVQAETEAIVRDQCWCTHSCFIQDSSKFSAKAQLFLIPWAYLRQRLRRSAPMTLNEAEAFQRADVA